MPYPELEPIFSPNLELPLLLNSERIEQYISENNKNSIFTNKN
jgi:hypothetical protein